MEKEIIQRPLKYDHNLACDICWEVATTPYSFNELCKQHEHWPTKETTLKWARDNSEFAEQLSEAIDIKEEHFSKDVKRESLLKDGGIS